MKTITQRALVREPLKAKCLTRAGNSNRRKAIDEILDEVLLEKPAKVSVAKLLKESRR